jgi:hypothetical protein
MPGEETPCCATTSAATAADESGQNLWNAQKITINMDGNSMRGYYVRAPARAPFVHVYSFIWRFFNLPSSALFYLGSRS